MLLTRCRLNQVRVGSCLHRRWSSTVLPSVTLGQFSEIFSSKVDDISGPKSFHDLLATSPNDIILPSQLSLDYTLKPQIAVDPAAVQVLLEEFLPHMSKPELILPDISENDKVSYVHRTMQGLTKLSTNDLGVKVAANIKDIYPFLNENSVYMSASNSEGESFLRDYNSESKKVMDGLASRLNVLSYEKVPLAAAAQAEVLEQQKREGPTNNILVYDRDQNGQVLILAQVRTGLSEAVESSDVLHLRHMAQLLGLLMNNADLHISMDGGAGVDNTRESDCSVLGLLTDGIQYHVYRARKQFTTTDTLLHQARQSRAVFVLERAAPISLLALDRSFSPFGLQTLLAHLCSSLHITSTSTVTAAYVRNAFTNPFPQRSPSVPWYEAGRSSTRDALAHNESIAEQQAQQLERIEASIARGGSPVHRPAVPIDVPGADTYPFPGGPRDERMQNDEAMRQRNRQQYYTARPAEEEDVAHLLEESTVTGLTESDTIADCTIPTTPGIAVVWSDSSDSKVPKIDSTLTTACGALHGKTESTRRGVECIPDQAPVTDDTSGPLTRKEALMSVGKLLSDTEPEAQLVSDKIVDGGGDGDDKEKEYGQLDSADTALGVSAEEVDPAECVIGGIGTSPTLNRSPIQLIPLEGTTATATTDSPAAVDKAQEGKAARNPDVAQELYQPEQAQPESQGAFKREETVQIGAKSTDSSNDAHQTHPQQSQQPQKESPEDTNTNKSVLEAELLRTRYQLYTELVYNGHSDAYIRSFMRISDQQLQELKLNDNIRKEIAHMSTETFTLK